MQHNVEQLGTWIEIFVTEVFDSLNDLTNSGEASCTMRTNISYSVPLKNWELNLFVFSKCHQNTKVHVWHQVRHSPTHARNWHMNGIVINHLISTQSLESLKIKKSGT